MPSTTPSAWPRAASPATAGARSSSRRRPRRRAAVTTAGAIDGNLERHGITLPQLHHGTDLTTWAVLDAAVRREREIRIGFEDTFALPDARRASSNAELVAAAVERYDVRPSG